MSNSLEIARQAILAPSGLDENQLADVLGRLMTRSVDNADLYFQLSRQESWALEDSIVKEGSHNIEQGVGVRAMSGEKTGFAYSDEIVLPALTQASDMARAIAKSGGNGTLQAWRRSGAMQLYAPIDPLGTMSDADKVALLQRIDAEARRMDPRVKQVMITLAGGSDTIMIAGSDGTLAGDVRPLVRFSVQVIAEQDGRREIGYAGGGGRFGYGYFVDEDRALALAREAVRSALINLEAEPAPAGTMTVVLGPGWPGVLLHEAIGHGLEGDFNRKGTSAFAGRLGERVASELCTVV
ncbi:MAG TPA: metallopeptidase TldD-related protein, partial [Gammaproteobacteria bacterium]|nr:metallopeptidase TldD-related protein [Gammaproteobacteria bacterium]